MPNCPLKCLESIKLHLPEDLKRDLQDLAMQEERAVSEYIRAVLQLHVYGAKAKLPTPSLEEKAR
ncbi:MAG: hypothetical protein P9F19_01360 [Candidatus Contendobacter sp.]|nr:hypothetical protein [Candidatus Contendobacter sp.]MDG4556037.1 hypothetical protein [Candidatus Contendobacter sp.]